MFGLLRVPKGFLSEDEFKVFQGHYCGVCNALGRLGFPGYRLATSYDGAALALFFSGLGTKEVSLDYKPCPFSPWRKKHQAKDCQEAFDFAAAASIGIVKLKAEDEIIDTRGRLQRGMATMLLKVLDKKAPAWPEFRETAALQRQAETRESPWFDELAYPSGLLLGSLAQRAAAVMNREQEEAYRVGENLGKWIYTWDSLWDFEDDAASNRFNAIAASYNTKVNQVRELDKDIFAELDFVLERVVSETVRNVEALQLGLNGKILTKLIRGANSWHKRAFAREFFKGEVQNERLPMSWQPGTCNQPSRPGAGTGGAN